jgi:hypothetical protein
MAVTVTVGPSHDYASLSAAFAGEAGSLSDDLIIELHPMEDTTEADTGSGWTLNGHSITLRTVGGVDGAWRTDRYRLVVTSTGSQNFRCFRDRVGIKIEGLQARLNRSTTGSNLRSVARADNQFADAEYEDLLLVLNTTNAGGRDHTGLFESTPVSGRLVKVKNSIGYIMGEGALSGWSGAELGIGGTGDGVSFFHNCAAESVAPGSVQYIESGFGVIDDEATAEMTCRNCWVAGCSSGGNGFLNVAAGSDYLRADVGPAPGANSEAGVTPTVESRSGADFRPTDADTVVVDQGVDLSTDTDLAVTVDIAGVSRPQGSAYDIGPFELEAGAPLEIRTQIRDSDVSSAVSNLRWAVFASTFVGEWQAPAATGTDGEISAEGELVVDLGTESGLEDGQLVWLYVSESDGSLAGQFRHHGGPVQVSQVEE